MQNVKRLVAALLLLMLMLSLAWAAPQPVEKKATKDRSAQPITVKSDQLQAYNEAKQAVFTGRVVARQDDVTIYSDRLEVYYGESDDEVDKIIASGNVRILQTNRVGTGGHAVYESKLGKITLTENPRVSQDTDTVTGKVIIYYLDEERSEVQSGDNARVEAVI
ncbi:MAG: lipopolysaccharide transport periplasmic protein LptA, partial [Geobacter sp.]